MPEYARTAPTPTLNWEGTIATITGVRYVWMDHCCHAGCRLSIEGWADGGTIVAGIKDGKFVELHYPPALPTPPETCPWCGRLQPLRRFGRPPLPVRVGHDAINAVWEQLAASHTDLYRAAVENTPRGSTTWLPPGTRP